MTFIEQWKKLGEWDYTFFFAAFLGLVSPGILMIWRFYPHYLETFSVPKLILLAVSCTVPANSFNVLLIDRTIKREDKIASPAFIVVACGATVVIFGIPLLLSVFLPLKICHFVGLIVICEMLFFLLLKYTSRKKVGNSDKK